MSTAFDKEGLPEDLLTSKTIGDRKIKTDGTPKDYYVEVALGNVEGSVGVGRVSRSDATNSSESLPIWGGDSHIEFATSNEVWSVASDSENDNIIGTGARAIRVVYLDEDYVEQVSIIELNGTTPVQVGIDCFRPSNASVIGAGSSNHNEGELVISNTASSPMAYIKPTICDSKDTYYTVPAGKELILGKVSPYLGKDDSGEIKGLVSFFGSNVVLTVGTFPVYQNTFDINFEVPFVAPEKTDIWYEFKSNDTQPTTISLVIEFILKDIE